MEFVHLVSRLTNREYICYQFEEDWYFRYNLPPGSRNWVPYGRLIMVGKGLDGPRTELHSEKELLLFIFEKGQTIKKKFESVLIPGRLNL